MGGIRKLQISRGQLGNGSATYFLRASHRKLRVRISGPRAARLTNGRLLSVQAQKWFLRQDYDFAVSSSEWEFSKWLLGAKRTQL